MWLVTPEAGGCDRGREDIPVVQGWEGLNDSLIHLFTLYLLQASRKALKWLIIKASGASAC